MKVEVRLFATLAAYLPPTAAGDSVVLEVPDGTTVSRIVESLAIPETVECLRVVNGHDASPDRILEDRDVLSVFPPLVGGQ